MRTRTLFIAAMLTLTVAAPATPQANASPDDLQIIRNEIEALRKSQEAMQKDLQEIKALLRARAGGAVRPAPADVKVSLDGQPVRGDAGAKLVLVEFSDYQCPFCQRVARETMPQLVKEYVSTGKVRHVFKDLPLQSIHPNAFRAAVAAACAGEQGKYWELHEKLFENGRQLGAEELPRYAEAVGLQKDAFAQCLGSGRFDAEIRADMREAGAAGITGTPAFLLGTTDDAGKLTVAPILSGAQSYLSFKSVIDELLTKK